MRKSRVISLTILGLTALVVTVLDQIAKAWVVATLPVQGMQTIIDGFLRFRYTENTGAAFGFLHGWTGALSIAAVAIIVGIIMSATRLGSGSPGMMLALGLVAGGAVGNLIDRVRLGYVVDFIEANGVRADFNGTIYTFPVFNVADSAITVGVILLMLLLIFGWHLEEPQKVEKVEPLPVRYRSHDNSPWFKRPDLPNQTQNERGDSNTAHWTRELPGV